MNQWPNNLNKIIELFSRLPGIGPKTAERLVFYLLNQEPIFSQNLAAAILNAGEAIKKCHQCHNWSEKELCLICADKNRDQSVITVVAEQQDVVALEKTHAFGGVYHILEGYLNPIEGIMPEKLNIKKLFERINSQKIKEIILALNPTIEGETTALYLTKILKKSYPNIKITRLARGLPQGGDLEYADEITLTNAFKGRTVV
ncbi:MAG TPA: recombination mediator RecR [bacterium]|nr:recombination mediator RecR [bacterium]HPL95209.1 recombination mediator RecR [bacterium]